jgi:MFS family permease
LAAQSREEPLPPLALAAVVVLMGLGLGVGQPLTMAWLAAATPPGLRGRAMSLRLTGNRLGQVVIPSAVGALAAGVVLALFQSYVYAAGNNATAAFWICGFLVFSTADRAAGAV